MSAVSELRAFNRFYTRRLGLLDEHLSDSACSLGEARILYELAQARGLRAADLSRLLRMDKGQLSRILKRLVRAGLIAEEIDPRHAKRKPLVLTAQGQAVFGQLTRAASTEIQSLLSPLTSAEVERLVASARTIRDILGEGMPDEAPPFVLREPQPGDFGWIIHRQAILYTAEYGWDQSFEGLASGIVGTFIAQFDPERERVWIAERNGKILGSVFLARDTDDVGKLRLLYVEPDARGLGLGSALVEECIRHARNVGYGKLRLWTNHVLTAARHIYEKAGFRLVEAEAHRSFGHDLIGEIWELDLRLAEENA